MEKKYLIAEYCRGPFYMGWHVYLRDSAEKNKRNAGGSWGWINRPGEDPWCSSFLRLLGITIKGDGTCDDGGIAEIASRWPIPGEQAGGKPRGCIHINIDYDIFRILEAE